LIPALGLSVGTLLCMGAYVGAGALILGDPESGSGSVPQLEFTYFPLIGEVEAVPKYVHNIVMILVVAFTGWLAVRPRTDQAPRPSELLGMPKSLRRTE
jgi:hypothetical protein